MTKNECVDVLVRAGISLDDAFALRRISMTLHRWHELECGDSNRWASFCLVRGKKNGKDFEYDDNGKPFMETHPNDGSKTRYDSVPDRERGALKRLGKIMARYSGFTSYIQGDPRGASLYILPPNICDSRDDPPAAPGWLEANYTRGIAVYK